MSNVRPNTSPDPLLFTVSKEQTPPAVSCALGSLADSDPLCACWFTNLLVFFEWTHHHSKLLKRTWMISSTPPSSWFAVLHQLVFGNVMIYTSNSCCHFRVMWQRFVCTDSFESRNYYFGCRVWVLSSVLVLVISSMTPAGLFTALINWPTLSLNFSEYYKTQCSQLVCWSFLCVHIDHES